MNREYIIELYLIYKELLSSKQKEYFENYYFEDYSLSEISENFAVSRAIINKTIKIVQEKLIYYENILKIKEKQERINNLLNKMNDDAIKQELIQIISEEKTTN